MAPTRLNTVMTRRSTWINTAPEGEMAKMYVPSATSDKANTNKRGATTLESIVNNTYDTAANAKSSMRLATSVSDKVLVSKLEAKRMIQWKFFTRSAFRSQPKAVVFTNQKCPVSEPAANVSLRRRTTITGHPEFTNGLNTSNQGCGWTQTFARSTSAQILVRRWLRTVKLA